jgi:hypothetical protein
MTRILTILTILTIPTIAQADDARLLDAIQQVETGGQRDPAHATGDHGLALGWLQHHADHWADAQGADRSLPAWQVGATDLPTARRAAVAFWARYRANGDREKALTHHYGPAGRRGKAKWADPDGYWRKVQKELTK